MILDGAVRSNRLSSHRTISEGEDVLIVQLLVGCVTDLIDMIL